MYLKWIATITLIVGTAVNSFGVYPLGPLLLLLGGVFWLLVSIKWKETSLIITNLVMVIAGAFGIIYNYM